MKQTGSAEKQQLPEFEEKQTVCKWSMKMIFSKNEQWDKTEL